ncbi:MAG: ABC transporter permease [Lachnospiraceae bacterium]|nr:ABC transporter permease [Lachnospiraceae bacterium]
MKRFFKSLSLKRLILLGSAVLALIIALIIKLICTSKANSLTEQMAWKRWGNLAKDTQISVFFDKEFDYNFYNIRSLQADMEKKLLESSIVSESENANARQWIYAYSLKGSVDLEGEAGKTTANVYAVGGDFFEFHPLELVRGSYFESTDVMKDYILLDRELAWQLFGSNDIIGKQVWCGNIPLMVIGVYNRPESKFNEAAGNNAATAYISYESYGTLSGEESANGPGVDTYEIILPNPVKGFGLQLFIDTFKTDESKYMMIENAERFSFLSLLKVIRDFGKRSMSMKGIVYPYWENIARGYEDILAIFLLIRLILYLYAIVIAVIFIVIGLKSIPWKDLKRRFLDWYDDFKTSDHTKIKDFFKKISKRDVEDL